MCLLMVGIVFAPLRLERSSYRYAGMTMAIAIIVLVPAHSGWVVALHRFFEVSVGIEVGLEISALWPEHLGY